MKRIGMIAALLSAAAVSTFAYGVVDNGSGSRIRAEGPTITEERPVESFRSITLAGSGRVRYRRADYCRVTVTTAQSLIDHILTEVSGDRLTLRFEPGTVIMGADQVEFLVEGPELSDVRISGSGSFNSESVLGGTQLRVEISGSGSMNAKVEVETIEATINGSGSMEFKGIADRMKFINSGSGDLNATELRTDTASIRISGAGNCRLSVSEYLHVTIAGSGNVVYKGSPKVEFSGSGSGHVTALD